jgi:VID27 C-terminal WD40-like domain/VID27 PH-like domain
MIIRGADNESKLLCLPLCQEMNPVYHKDKNSFVWVTYDIKTRNPLYSELLKFDGDEGTEFNTTFCQGMYETLHLSQFAKVAAKDREYICQAYEDVEMEDAQSDEESAEEEYQDQDNTDHMASGSGQDKNSHLAVGYKNDRSFVVRGNRIGVFKQNQDNLEFSTTINNVSTMDGKSFTPSKVMLHRQGLWD